MHPDKLVFIHITKTGGSSFKQILKRNLGPTYHEHYGYIWEEPYKAEQIEWLFKTHSGFRCFVAHRLNLDLPFHSQHFSLKAITFVRDPASRFLSHYFFHRNNDMPGHEITQKLSIEEFVQHGLVEGKESWLIDGQLKYLTKNLDAVDLDAIKKLVDADQLYLFPLSSFDDTCVILEKELPAFFPDASYVRENVSIRDQRESPELRERIASYMNLDYRLLEIGAEQVERLKKKHFPTEEAFNEAKRDFERRCSFRLRYLWRPRKAAGKILRKMRILQ